MKNKSIHIIVLNYNGRELLKECLPSVVKAAGKYPGKCRVTVLDNRSSDDSVKFLKRNFRTVKVSVSPENLVLFSYNSFIREKTAEEIIVLLNNDIKVDPGFLLPMMKYFEKPGTFFVSPRHLGFDGAYQGGKNRIFSRFGFIVAGPFYPGFKNDIDTPSYTAFTGNGAFRRDMFLKLGGFDRMYFPGLLEDADLCFRAWREGLRGYYEPKSVIFHKGSVTFKKEFGDKRLTLGYRNSFLFAWKNFNGARLFTHILALPFTLLAFLFTARFRHLAGFIQALKMSGQVKKGPAYRFSASAALKLFNSKNAIAPFAQARKDLSIIIPAYNRADGLKALLLSLMPQLGKGSEAIVVDDGSTDPTPSVVKKLQKKYKNLLYIRQANSGPAAARNAGIKTAAGKIAGFLDSDVIASKNLVKSLVSIFRKNPSAAGVEGATTAPPGSPQPGLFSHAIENLKGGRFLTCNIFYKKEALHEAGGFDERYRHPAREDSDIAFAVLKQGGKIIFNTGVLVFHPVYPGSFKSLFKQAYYSGYDALLCRKYPSLYFSRLKWVDGWFVPAYYGGFYTLPFFIWGWLASKNTALLSAGIALYALSYIVSIFALFRKRKTALTEFLHSLWIVLLLPWVRLFWAAYGFVKYFLFN